MKIGNFKFLGVILILGMLAGLAGCKRKASAKIGFYNLSEEYTAAIQKQISKTDIKIKYLQLTQKDLENPKINKKVDLLFAYNDANTKTLKEQAVPLNKEVLSLIPGSIKNSNWYKNSKNQTVIMPVVLDNFETSVLRTTRTKYGIEWPSDFSGLIDFGEEAKKYYSSPIVISGAGDINVLSLFTETVIAFGGQTGYEKLLNQLQNAENLGDFENFVISDEDADSKITVKNVINELKKLQQKGILASDWTHLTEKDTSNLIDDNRIGAIFMNLSENRRKTMPNIYYYEINIFPVKTESKELTVQPVIVSLSFADNSSCQKILSTLSNEENQAELSLETKLGPAMLKGAPCDVQADDARYLAASTQGGPVPDLGTASYKTEEQRHALAEKIRSYF